MLSYNVSVRLSLFVTFVKIMMVVDQNYLKIALIWFLVRISPDYAYINIFRVLMEHFIFAAFTYLLTKMNSVTNGSVNSSTLQKFKNAFVAHVPNYKGNL